MTDKEWKKLNRKSLHRDPDDYAKPWSVGCLFVLLVLFVLGAVLMLYAFFLQQ